MGNNGGNSLSQINKLAAHPSMNLISTAHENGTLNFFDFTANKVVKNIGDAHSDGISSVVFSNSGLHMITGCHNGSLKVWDVRTYKCVSELKEAHLRKYDEGVMCIATHQSMPFFATGGADSIINIFELYV